MFRSSLSATRLLRHGIKTQPTTMCLLPNRGVIAESTKFFATKGNDEPKVDRKAQALAIALKHIEKKHGKGSLMKLGDNPIRENVEVISTGSLVLDDAIGIGGLPKGRIVEIYGPESSGKTTIALHIVAEAQRMGGMATFIDSEHALDANYAKALGVNIDDLYLAQPDSGEQALEICDALVRSNAMSVVVVDSVAALTPRAEIEGEMGDPHMALQARLMSQALRKLTPNVSRSNCLLIFINQVRSKIGLVFGNPEVTSGGNALKFYSSVRIRVARDGTKTIQQDGQAVGCACKVKIVKNKMAPPFKEVRVNLMFGKGFSKENDLFELATTYGFIQRKGAWYTVETDTGEMKQFNGQASLVKSLEENKDFCEYLVAKVRQRMTMGSSDSKEDQVLEGNDEVTDTDGRLNEIETGEVEEDAVTVDTSKENGDATLEFGSAESIDADVTKSDTNSSTSLEYDTRDTKISTDTSVTKEKAATKPKKRKGKKSTLTAAV